MSTLIAQARGLGYRFRSRKALDSLSFDLSPGITGLLGPNGAGKSTLLGLLSTRRSPDLGELQVLGQDVAARRGREAVRRQLGFLPQRYALVGSMRVLDTIAYAAWTHGLTREASWTAAEEALAEVGIPDLGSRRVRSLSGGQRQRVGLAAALAHRPAILILDEPTAGLDAEVRHVIRRTLTEISSRTSVVVSTHLLEDVTDICNDMLVVDSGRLIFQGSPAELGRAGNASDVVGASSSATLAERGYLAILEQARSRES